MARKKQQRPDAERRARQCERLSRVVRVLHCIMGPGRWDAESLARELEVSPRTLHRIMQTLSMANVPWHWDKDSRCYRVRPGFRFPALDSSPESVEGHLDVVRISDAAARVLQDGERFLEGLRAFREALRTHCPFQATVKKIDSILDVVERILHPKRLGELTASRISTLVSELRDGGRSESTIASYLAHLRAALSWAVSVKLLATVPKFKKPKRAKLLKKPKGRAPTEEEFQKILQAVADVVGSKRAASWQHFYEGLW